MSSNPTPGPRPADDTEHQRRYTEAIRAAREESPDAFQSWFNVSESVDKSLVRGTWDFAAHILTPGVVGAIQTPEAKTVLEIGYGGGRILMAAARFFGQAVGCDIHDEAEAVAQLAAEQGLDNIRLVRSGGRDLPVDDASIDLVYSFIVLQHLPSWEVMESYVAECQRVLRPGGIAQLYYGSYRHLTRPQQLKAWFRGYHEITDAPVNFTSLVVRPARMAALARRHGFTILDRGRSYKCMPDGFPHWIGGQEYLTLRKPGGPPPVQPTTRG